MAYSPFSKAAKEKREIARPLLVGPAKPHKSDKGEKGGSCNREACQRPGAYWFNHSTRRYYCRACAHWLNAANREDAARLYGHDLCTEEKA